MNTTADGSTINAPRLVVFHSGKKIFLDINYFVGYYVLVEGERKMKFLSRSEEFVLLSVLYLQEDAYGVAIRNQLQKMTGQSWAFGAVFVTLSRLEKKQMLESRLADPSPRRGGKSKRIYSLTPDGLEELARVRRIQAAAWKSVPASSLPR
jgi:PadR family transcriptional regulator PadR